MALKLIESAQTRWRAVNAPHLVALVRAGAVFKNGKLIERSDESNHGRPGKRAPFWLPRVMIRSMRLSCC